MQKLKNSEKPDTTVVSNRDQIWKSTEKEHPWLNRTLFILVDDKYTGLPHPVLVRAKYVKIDPKKACGATRRWDILEKCDLELNASAARGIIGSLPQMYDVILWRFTLETTGKNPRRSFAKISNQEKKEKYAYAQRTP